MTRSRIGHPTNSSWTTIVTMSLSVPTVLGLCARIIFL